jgi:hypothetical protein
MGLFMAPHWRPWALVVRVTALVVEALLKAMAQHELVTAVFFHRNLIGALPRGAI